MLAYIFQVLVDFLIMAFNWLLGTNAFTVTDCFCLRICVILAILCAFYHVCSITQVFCRKDELNVDNISQVSELLISGCSCTKYELHLCKLLSIFISYFLVKGI